MLETLNNNIFVFRVDASEKIGLGHLVRCLIIAELVVSKGFEVVFYTAKSLSQNIIESRGFRCYRLGDTAPNLNELYNRFLVIADINSDAIFKKTADYYDNQSNLLVSTTTVHLL